MPAQLATELVPPCQWKMVETSRKGRSHLYLKVRSGKLGLFIVVLTSFRSCLHIAVVELKLELTSREVLYSVGYHSSKNIALENNLV